MKRFFLFFAIAGSSCLMATQAQATEFSYRGLDEDLPWPQWTTPTPFCYDVETEVGYNIRLRNSGASCTNENSCNDNGGYFSSYRSTSIGIVYPPFNRQTLLYEKKRDWGGFSNNCDVRSATGNWYSPNITASNMEVDDFGNLDHLRYASYRKHIDGVTTSVFNSNHWMNELLNCARDKIAFNRLPIIANNIQQSNHVRTNVIKQVYYGDTDGNVDQSLSTWVGNGNVRSYCFVPTTRNSLYYINYTSLDRGMDGEYNVNSKRALSYDKVWGTANDAHNYRFRVADWNRESIRNSVYEWYGDATIEAPRLLNNGVEVYIVLLEGETMSLPNNNEYGNTGKSITFYGKPRMLRTHVYPVKPKWRTNLFKNNYCVSDGSINLMDYVDIGNIPFSGKFEVIAGNNNVLSGYTLTFSQLGNITSRQQIRIRCYPYWIENNEGKNPYMEFTAYVYPSPTLTVVNAAETVCSDNAEFTPARYAENLAGTGTYAGSYISNGKLNAEAATAGNRSSVSITYTYKETESGCTATGTYTQPISRAPNLSDFTMPKTTFCFDETINLRECTSVTGGTFSGFGVNSDDETFSSVVAGLGNGDIYFRKTENGCTAEKKHTVSIRDLQQANVVFSKPPAMCANDDYIYLPDYLSDSWAGNGQFTGKGVEHPRFYPDRVNSEFTTVTYTYGNTGCKLTLTQELRVKTPATLTVSGNTALCSDSEVDLSPRVNIKGGTWSGGHVSGSIFSPVSAGIGVHPVGYSITDNNGCRLSTTFNVAVNDLLGDVTFGGIPEQCGSDGSYIDLRDYVHGHTVGTFSGSGVENFRFYPAQARAGFNTLTYRYGNGGCSTSKTTEVFIHAVPSVTFERFDRVCDNDPIKLMDYVSPKGGTFTGSGVVDNIFYPTQAGLGTHSIGYTTAIGSCNITGSAFINVVGLSDNDAAFRTLPEVCITDDSYIDLRGYIVNAPDNGTFTGSGVEGFRYYPANGKLGFSTITYSFMSGNCPKTIRSEVFVRNVPAVSFRAIPTMCTNTTIDLMNYVSQRGGTFSGNGVFGSTFYAEQAGVGRHEVTYRINSSGCASVAKVTIDVADLLDEHIAFRNIAPVCKSDSNWLDLRVYINHDGGTFSGQGVENYRFYPSRASEGYVQLSYNYGTGSCRRTASVEVLVLAKPAINLSPLPTICESGVEVNLQSYANPKGGTFSGVGVYDNVFSAAVAQTGRHTISYSYTDDRGCKNVVAGVLDVSNSYSPNVTFGGLTELCSTDAGYYELSDYVQGHTGGTFSGTGVSGGRFYPAQARTGINTLTYTYGTGTCQKVLKADVNVLPVPVTRPITLAKVCSDEPVVLMNHVNNKGGEFIGTGVSNNLFYPTHAGFGVHDISYHVTIDNCESSASLQADVLSVATPPTFESISTLCKSDSGYIDLREYILNYQEGTFSGQGVENYRFYPGKAKDGFNTLTYTYGSGSCQRSLRTEVYVTPRAELSLTPFSRICEADTIALAAYANILGGAWSGKGVFGSNFIAEQAGTGVHALTYTATQGTCRVSGTVNVEVASLLPNNVDFTAPASMCVQDLGFIILADYVQGHTGGTFSGNGVSNGRFYPAQARVGFNQITYTYGTGNCQRTLRAEIEVTNSSATKVTISQLPRFCKADTINLFDYVSAKGGTFTGAGVVHDTLFYSEFAGVGTHELVYQVNVGNCNSYATANVQVLSLNRTDIRFKTLPDFCNTQSEALDLFDLVENSRDGAFSGKGVEQSRYFYPNKVGADVSTITYTYGTGICQQRITADLKIYTAPNRGTIDIEDVLSLCGGTLDLGAMVEPKGGVFTGSYISADGVFDGNAAPLGETEVVYSVANKGCRLTKSILIKNEPAQTFDFSVKVEKVDKDKADDISNLQAGCAVRFIPERTDMKQYTWYFGDGAYSLQVSPPHYYYHLGTFDVKLNVQNKLGCILTTVKAGMISVGVDTQGSYVDVAGVRYYTGGTTPSTEELSEVKSVIGCAELEVVLFPNPVKDGTLNISRVECVERVEIYDLSMSLQLVVNEPTGSVAVGALRSGMYLVALRLVDGGLKVGKILIP